MANHPLVFHHTPDIGLYKPADWCVLEYAARDKSIGYAGIFRLGTGAAGQNGTVGRSSDEYLFRPRGLDPSRRYRVTLDSIGKEVKVEGFELITNGIRVYLDTPHTSELLLFKEIKNETKK